MIPRAYLRYKKMIEQEEMILRLKKQGCRRNVEKTFFSLRITDIWNKLPNSIVNAYQLCLLKTKIDNLFGDTKCLMYTADMISKI